MAETGAVAARGPSPSDRTPWLHGRPSDEELTRQLMAPLWRPTPTWWILLGISGALALLFLGTVAYTVTTGIGVWGNNIPVAWGFPIVNFVWWIGIGHAGTFISAFLLLMGQPWRASINRLAEAMTLFALVNAGLFPLLHMGRLWFAYWIAPYPTNLGIWPQFKSSLPWDLAAILAYFTVSLLFWYLGLVPDLATVRDRARGRVKKVIYGVFALGWRGSSRQWRRYHVAYVLLAAIATPLVVSVHSIVSSDFSVALVPGWHSTIFAPYFVAGAIYSGMAMVVALLILVRRGFELENVITERHLDYCARLILATGWMLIYAYAVESFIAWYSVDEFERATYLVQRTTGTYAWMFWGMLAVNVLVPQLFWSRALRRSVPVLFGASVLILAAMWAERFIIVVGSLSQDFLPSSWHPFTPTLTDLGMLLGSFGLFAFLFLLFLRSVPVVPMHEVKKLRFDGAGEA